MTWTDTPASCNIFVVWDPYISGPMSTEWDGVGTIWDSDGTSWDAGATTWDDAARTFWIS